MNTIITLAMFTLFGWFISHYAKNNMPRLIWSAIGLYFIAIVEIDSLLYVPSSYFGLGILLPHFKFLYEWVNEVINTIKLAFQNTYYFFITVYYKTRNTFYWFINFYEKIQAFFYKRKNKKAYEKFYKDDGYKYEEPKREKQKSYQKEEKKQKSYSKQEGASSKKQENDKFKQFYKGSAYAVLGVSADDDYKIIKKAYRKLINEYHPDVNQHLSSEELNIYKEISQNINNAWEKVESWKK